MSDDREDRDKSDNRKSHREYMEGVPVTEEMVAADLGFADVHAFRRWNTEQGRKVAEMEHELKQAGYERDSFKWAGQRMQAVLEKIKADGLVSDRLALLAIDVVCGQGVDWEHELEGTGWLPGTDREAKDTATDG